MPGQLRLQDYTEISTATVQLLDQAVDLGDFGTVVVRVSVSRAATSGTLVLQHAAILDEAGFDDVVLDETFDLSVLGTEVGVIRAPLRYLRWRAEVSGTAGFEVDLVGRTPAQGGVELDALDDPVALGGAAVKSSDETVTSDTTLADDAELTLPVAAWASYAVEGMLLIDADPTPDFKWTFDVPSGATMRWTTDQYSTNAATSGAGDVAVSSGAGAVRSASCIGTVYTGATAGSLTLQWAQNASSANNTTLKRGSWLKLRRFD